MIFKKLLADLRVLLGQAAPATSSKSDGVGDKPLSAMTLERESSNASTTVSSSSSSSTESSPRAADTAKIQAADDDQELHVEGLEQSPIDICALDSELVLQDDEEIQVVLGDAAHVHIVHVGSNFRVEWLNDDETSRSCIKINGKTFYAVQFHFHAPSTS